MAERSARTIDALSPEAKEVIVDRLRERIYVTFTSITVLYALSQHAHGLTVSAAVGSLLVAALGTVVASGVAEVVAHIFVHGQSLTRPQLSRMAKVGGGALSSVVLPALILLAAAWDWWSLETAFDAAIYLLIATLALVIWSGVRRSRRSALGKVVAVASLSLLMVLALVVKAAAH